MKKFTVCLAMALILALTFSYAVSAGPEYVVENPPITVPNSSPVVDGNINENEGWSVSALMNYDTLGFYWHTNPLTMDGNVRFAWDDAYMYCCANILDGLEATHGVTGETIPAGFNSFIYSTGEDDIDGASEDGNTYGFNGDIFGILIDPLGIMLDAGFTTNFDYTPWYLVGLFEGDEARMYREQINEGDITDQVKVAGHKTEQGWCFEAAIPWDMIISDVEDISYGECVVDKATLLSNGSLVRVGALYQDRFFDPEAEIVDTWTRVLTAPTDLANGWHGEDASGPNVLTCGIKLNISKEVVGETTVYEDVSVNTGGAGNNTEVVTDEQGNTVTDNSGNAVTQTAKSTTKKATTGGTTGGDAAQTFDIGIAMAIGALAISGVGIAATKKKR